MWSRVYTYAHTNENTESVMSHNVGKILEIKFGVPSTTHFNYVGTPHCHVYIFFFNLNNSD